MAGPTRTLTDRTAAKRSTNCSVDPGFVSYDDDPQLEDFHLAPTSPRINAGDPAVKDPDGSRSDPGIFSGAEASGWEE